jgi:hypothetical protein
MIGEVVPWNDSSATAVQNNRWLDKLVFIQALWRGSRKVFPDEVSGFSAPKRTRTWPRVECSGTLSIRINISADLSEFLYPPRRKILPLLQSGAISYSLPGLRYAPPWANVYRLRPQRFA